MSSERKFYVYVHRRLDDGSIFYVGKGTGKRAWYFKGRSEWWHRVNDKHGTTVEICQNFLSEDSAYLLEMWIIAKLKHLGNVIVNMTYGGDAPPKFDGEKHPQYNSKIIKLRHLETNDFFIGTRREFLQKYKTTQGNFSTFLMGKQNSHAGWIREDQDPEKAGRKGKNHHSYDHCIYSFENLDGRKFEGTRYEFRDTFNLPVLELNTFIRGERYVFRGWFLSHMKDSLPPGNKGIFNNKHDKRIFEFRHKDGKVFTGTGLALNEIHGTDADGVYRLKTGKSKFHKGWEMVRQVHDN